MKVKMLTLAAALLLMAAMAYAQPAVITFWIGYEGGTYADHHLMTQCTQSPPLPMGARIEWWWDVTGNGPSADDQLYPLGGDGANFNVDYTNDQEFPGSYASLTGWVVNVPGQRYYLKIYCDHDGQTVHYISPSTLITTGPQDAFFPVEVFTCSPCVAPPTCTPDASLTLTAVHFPYPAQQGVCSCVHLMAGTVTQLIVTPACNASNMPIISYTAGCDQPNCAPLDPATVVYNPNGWVFVPGPNCSGYMMNTITTTSPAGCCLTVCLDAVLPVGLSSFAAVAADNDVELNWVTASETNLDHFVVLRNNTPITTVRATNSGEQHTYTYSDKSAVNGTTYTYKLVAVNIDGTHAAEKTVEGVTPSANKAIVTEYALHQNYPNPFNPSTMIRYDLVDANYVSLKVYNANGQVVATLVNGNMPKGVNMVSFDATNLTSGLYFYTVKVGNVYSATKKMLLVK